MFYLISCLVVYVALVLAAKRFGLLPLVDCRGTVDVPNTVGSMLLGLFLSAIYPIVLPAGLLILYVLHDKKENK